MKVKKAVSGGSPAPIPPYGCGWCGEWPHQPRLSERHVEAMDLFWADFDAAEPSRIMMLGLPITFVPIHTSAAWQIKFTRRTHDTVCDQLAKSVKLDAAIDIETCVPPCSHGRAAASVDGRG